MDVELGVSPMGLRLSSSQAPSCHILYKQRGAPPSVLGSVGLTVGAPEFQPQDSLPAVGSGQVTQALCA